MLRMLSEGRPLIRKSEPSEWWIASASRFVVKELDNRPQHVSISLIKADARVARKLEAKGLIRMYSFQNLHALYLVTPEGQAALSK